MIFVIKANGKRRIFNPNKVLRTCRRMGLSREESNEVLEYVESKLYDNIPTSKILDLIFEKAREIHPKFEHSIDLRRAISLLRPKPDFESFIGNILMEYGYEITRNQIIPGKCVEHEIDAIAKKNGETIHVEIKHHFNFHTYTSLRIMLEAWAVYQDLREGFKLGLHEFDVKKTIVISNTKLSEHAKKYAICKGLEYIGWRYPGRKGLEYLIEKKKIYPITMLRGVRRKVIERLCEYGYVTIKQIVESDLNKISKKTGLSLRELREISKRAELLLE